MLTAVIEAGNPTVKASRTAHVEPLKENKRK
jgi:hypothetical protein